MTDERADGPTSAGAGDDGRGGEGGDGRVSGRAVSVETVVIPDRGQWRVEIIVLFTDGVVRRRVGTFATRQRAEIWADLVRRAAERDIPWPPRGDGQA